MSQAAENPYERLSGDVRDPPRGLWNTLRFMGPGVILVGSVVGSGEILMTTNLGATVGFVMLWWMLLSCWGKSIVQAELTRYSVSSGETALDAFNHLPGKLPGRGRPVSWFLYLWLFTLLPGVLSGGGIYGATGQAVNLALPFLSDTAWTVVLAGVAAVLVLTGTYRFLEKLLLVMVVTFTFVTLLGAVMLQFSPYAVTWADLRSGLRLQFPAFAVGAALAAYGGTGVTAGESMTYTYWCIEKGYARFAGRPDGTPEWVERAKGWIHVMQTDVLLTLVLLTFATIPFYMLGAGVLSKKPVFRADRALAARLTDSGRVDASVPAEFRRHHLVLPVTATISQQLPGARWEIVDPVEHKKYILRSEGDGIVVYQPADGKEAIRVLSQIYTETLGPWAFGLFMLGAFFVLYSTVVSGLGGGARMFADALVVLGLIDRHRYASRLRILRMWAVGFPILTSTCYYLVPNPIWLLTVSGVVSALMTPIVAGSTLYLRYTRLDRRIGPTWKADATLWICFAVFLVLAVWAVRLQFGI